MPLMGCWNKNYDCQNITVNGEWFVEMNTNIVNSQFEGTQWFRHVISAGQPQRHRYVIQSLKETLDDRIISGNAPVNWPICAIGCL